MGLCPLDPRVTRSVHSHDGQVLRTYYLREVRGEGGGHTDRSDGARAPLLLP